MGGCLIICSSRVGAYSRGGGQFEDLRYVNTYRLIKEILTITLFSATQHIFVGCQISLACWFFVFVVASEMLSFFIRNEGRCRVLQFLNVLEISILNVS